jgi:predicted DNA-binding transcriptional regulator YafY
MKSAKRPQLRRLQLIDLELRRNRYPTASKLAELLEVNLRTVQRDIAFMQSQWNAPIAFSKKHNGWFYASQSFSLPSQQLTKDQLLAMFVAQQSLQQNPSSPLNDSLSRAVDALAGLLPEISSIVRTESKATHSIRQTALPFESAQSFTELTRAILEKHSIRIIYRSVTRSGETSRMVDPWHVSCINGAWYLFGWCHLRRELRMFALTRLQKIEVLDDTFERPREFSLNDTLGGAFQVYCEPNNPIREISLRCNPEVSRFIRERSWHPSQSLEENFDGSIVLHLKLNSFVEVARWIQYWGDGIEVIRPESLREMIYERAQSMAIRNLPQKPRKPR